MSNVNNGIILSLYFRLIIILTMAAIINEKHEIIHVNIPFINNNSHKTNVVIMQKM